MKRKIGECLSVSINDKWGVLQENLSKNIEAGELKREKVWVKEGPCDECGVFDVLSRVDDKFICAECSKFINNKTKNGKRKK